MIIPVRPIKTTIRHTIENARPGEAPSNVTVTRDGTGIDKNSRTNAAERIEIGTELIEELRRDAPNADEAEVGVAIELRLQAERRQHSGYRGDLNFELRHTFSNSCLSSRPVIESIQIIPPHSLLTGKMKNVTGP